MSRQSLPDIFQFHNGDRMVSPNEWSKRREEILSDMLSIEYGSLPLTSEYTRIEQINTHTHHAFDDVTHTQYRVITSFTPHFDFILEVFIPQAQGPFPIILTGDACWHQPADEIIYEVIQRGYALALFNRAMIVPDNDLYGRETNFYLLYPEGDFGALSAWAWGYHRCIDALLTINEVSSNKIVVTGHSRGGKAALLAGALDERIALTVPNNSGCGGAGCFRFQGKGSETIQDILEKFPYWFSPRFKEYIGKESELPFDQHSLKACVAPRGLLTTEALDDLWANPSGTLVTHQAARELFQFLDAPNQIGIWFRGGAHQQGIIDWQVLMDFSDWLFYGKPPVRKFNVNPFPGIPVSF